VHHTKRPAWIQHPPPSSQHLLKKVIEAEGQQGQTAVERNLNHEPLSFALCPAPTAGTADTAGA
jgi:hypothetical protein